MELTEKRTGGRTVFEGRVIRVEEDEVLLPDGKSASREVVRHNGGVCVAPLTDSGELILVRQYRYPYGEITLELPAGKLEKGEDPLSAAKRELSEETGAEGRLTPLGEMYPTPGYSDEIIRLYAATELSFGKMHTDDDEFIETVKLSLKEAEEMVLDGRIKDGKTQVLVLKTVLLTERGLL